MFSIPGLWTEVPVDTESELVEMLKNGLNRALVSWNSFREREGQDLVHDLKQRIDKLIDIKEKKLVKSVKDWWKKNLSY